VGGAVAIPLDLNVVPDSHPLRWRTDDLQRVIDARLKVGPAVVEGVLAFNSAETGRNVPRLETVQREVAVAIAGC
jgi:hypothetical protein